jgi:hypothetical protein
MELSLKSTRSFPIDLGDLFELAKQAFIKVNTIPMKISHKEEIKLLNLI